MSNTNLDRAAAESLRNFALAHNEIAFAHLVTQALNQLDESWSMASSDVARVTTHVVGCDCTECCLMRTEYVRAVDAWAIKRIEPALIEYTANREANPLAVIRSTDTTCPSGATARLFTF